MQAHARAQSGQFILLSLLLLLLNYQKVKQNISMYVKSVSNNNSTNITKDSQMKFESFKISQYFMGPIIYFIEGRFVFITLWPLHLSYILNLEQGSYDKKKSCTMAVYNKIISTIPPDDPGRVFFCTDSIQDVVEKSHGITYSQKMLSDGGIVRQSGETFLT